MSSSPSVRFPVIYYQPFSPPDSFNIVNKPDQTKATCHNNHCPSTFRHRLGRIAVSAGLRLFSAKIRENNHHIYCPNSHSNNFRVLNLPLRRHTWLSESHNTVRLQETARREQELTFLPEKAQKACPSGAVKRSLVSLLPSRQHTAISLARLAVHQTYCRYRAG